MKKLQLVFPYFLFFIPLISYSQDWLWAKQASVYFPKNIVTDDNSDYYVSGRGNTLSTISKVNHNGGLTWSKSISNEIIDMIYTQGFIYCILDAKNILKLDTLGNIIFQKNFPGVYEVSSMAIDDNLDIYVTGIINDTLVLGSDTLIPSGISSAFITKMDTSGSFLMSRSLIGNLNFNRIIYHDNYLYSTGWFSGSSMMDTVSLTSNGGKDIFIGKLDLNGNCIWVKNAGGKHTPSYSMDQGFDIGAANGNLYITGSVTDSATFDTITLNNTRNYDDVFIAKYNINGRVNWVKRFGQWSDAEGRALVIDANQNIYAGGSFVGVITLGLTTLYGTGNYDLFVTKIDSSGNVIWGRSGGGSSWNDYVNSILIDSNNDLVFCGQFSNNAYMGNDTLMANPLSSNGYIAKMSAIVGINEVQKNNLSLSVYPNPTTSKFTINLSNSFSPKVVVKLSSLDGRIVFNEIVQTAATGHLKEINISDLPKGLYLLKIISDNEVYNCKIIKQ